jgi:pyruvate formate lyase activating enzyme
MRNTDISDNEETARQVTEWVLRELGPMVPMHFVRFHPDFRMRNTVRTPIPRLERAREIALAMGTEHVYLGNVYDTPFSNTFCRGCGAELVSRYGLSAMIKDVDRNGRCITCGRDANFKFLSPPPGNGVEKAAADVTGNRHAFDWHGDVRSLHVQLVNPTTTPLNAWYRTRYSSGVASRWNTIPMRPGETWRFIIAKSSSDDVGPEILVPDALKSNLHEVFDRAHFPTVSIEEAPVGGDISPFPIFQKRQVSPSM